MSRETLLKAISDQNIDDNEVAVSLLEFFEKNNDLGSIGYNLGDDQPSIATFYHTLQSIAARPDVFDVRVRIVGVDDDQWPYTDTVYIISSASEAEVSHLVSPLFPTEVSSGWLYGRPPALAEPQPPYKPYSIWWD